MEASRAAHVVDRFAPSLAANAGLVTAPQVAAPQSIDTIQPVIAKADIATAEEIIAKAFPAAPPKAEPPAAAASYALASADPGSAAELMARPVPDAPTASDEPKPVVVAALTDPAEVLPADQTASTSTAALPPQDDTGTAPRRIEIVGECLVVEPCIDQYLFALYERTPKEDTIKETERRKVTVKRKGKMVTVTRSFTRLVDNNFTWKDPKAAERVGMSMSDYVIGGMDKSFKMKLFYMLQAAENAGLQPGITSAFRDDYRQSIASGLKAASNRSFHGGSLRGGYGHGLAADIVSINGATRDQRYHSSEALWKWVDANGQQYGVGRPYLRFDPPHVGPISGPEYVSRRGGTRTAAAGVKKRQTQVAQARHSTAKPQVAASAPSSKPSRRLAQAR